MEISPLFWIFQEDTLRELVNSAVSIRQIMSTLHLQLFIPTAIAFVPNLPILLAVLIEGNQPREYCLLLELTMNSDRTYRSLDWYRPHQKNSRIVRDVRITA